MKRWLFSIFTAAVVAAMVGALVVPVAFRQRGYWAIGGEWLLIALTFIGVLWCVTGEKEISK